MAFLGKLTSFPLSGCNPENELKTFSAFWFAWKIIIFFSLFQMVIWTKTFVHNMKVFGFGTGSFGFKGGKWKCFPPKTNCFPLTRLDHSFLQFKI